MREYKPHVPAIDVSHSTILDAYSTGYQDGLVGRMFEPARRYQADQKIAYKAGFDKARE